MTAVTGRLSFLLLAVLAVALSLWLADGNESPDAPMGSIAAERVILFAPNLTETAHALGHGDLVIGVTDFCVWPQELLSRPRVGGAIDPNLERIAALSPDLLVVQGEAVALREFATSQGIRLEQLKMDDDIASILGGIRELDALLGGDGTRGIELADAIQSELDEIGSLSSAGEQPRVLLSLGHEPASLDGLYAVGNGGFLGELIAVAGGRNVFEDHPRAYFLLSLETLVAVRPEVVLELRPGEAVDEARRASLQGLWDRMLRSAPRVELLDFDGAMIPGPRIVETVRIFRDAIHPES